AYAVIYSAEYARTARNWFAIAFMLSASVTIAAAILASIFWVGLFFETLFALFAIEAGTILISILDII
ncbi:hypothetical protein PMAYCL1PPCAC_21371, partial [Pristionchus mayeri]